MSPFPVRLKFHNGLTYFLKSKTGSGIVERRLTEKSSVKDVIESCGVPHTEVDLILVDGASADFSRGLDCEANVVVYPVEPSPALFPEKRLQTRGLTKFVADGHLGKLVRDLRLLGFDVLYDRDAEDRQLLELMKIDDRALLTRDRRLLMHAVVQHGYYLRSQNPFEQTIEVIRRFELFSAIVPFTRCLRCNARLENVEKTEVIQQLEPLTRIYYEQFRQCMGCGRVYWAGSHFSKLERRIEQIQARNPSP